MNRIRLLVILVAILSINVYAQTATWAHFTHSGTANWWGENHYFDIINDPVSNSTLFWSAPGWTGGTNWASSPAGNVIYSSWFGEYKTNNTLGTVGTFTGIEPIGTSFFNNWGNFATSVSPCPADEPNFPSMMHPVKQMTIDTLRNRAIIGGSVVGFNDCFPNMTLSGATATAAAHFPPIPPGVAGTWVGKQVATSHNGGFTFTACPTPATILSVSASTMTLSNTTCDQTATSIQLLDTADVSPRQQLYAMALNSNPSTNTFTRLFPYPATVPDDNYTATYPPWAAWALAYDSDDDVIISYGGANSGTNPRMYVWCDTDLNAGVLTVKQIAAGCTAGPSGQPQFALVVPTGFDGTCGPGHPEPCPYNNTAAGVSIRYDTVSKKLWLYNGSNDNGVQGLWMYDVPTKTWTQKCTGGGCTLPPEDLAREAGPSTSNYNQTPWVYSSLTHLLYTVLWDGAAWELWYYTPTTDRWTQITLANTGSQPTGGFEIMTGYDLANNRIIAKSTNSASGPVTNLDIYELQLPGPTDITSLTIQETIYPGSVVGVTRTQDQVTSGIPLSQTANITNISQLGLSVATIGQFRVLGCWSGTPTPTLKATSCGGGAIKWVEIDTEADISAGGTNTSISLTTGAGNFGGSDLATDNGTTISVDTGVAQFTIKKANFNGIDIAVVGGITVVATGVSQGLVLTGPDPTASYPGNVTCTPNTGGSTCATVYSSANDPSSTCVIEENGPVKSVIKCTGLHIDGASHAYMQYTVREFFYSGKATMKVQSVLQNASFGLSNTFASAFKGLASYEFRIGANISGTLNYTVANHTGTPTSGTMSGTDTVTLYQGQSQLMQWDDCHTGSTCATLLTTDTGYVIKKNSSSLQTGTDSQYPQGWADITNGSGVGVEIGIEQLATKYPASLEFDGGGNDVRVGIFARENTQAIYQSWPQWYVTNFWFSFHSTAPASLANDFLSYQHFLVARATPYTYYNNANVFMYPMPDPTAEDNYYTNLGATASPSIAPSNACCIQDLGTSNISQFPLSFYKAYSWGATGGGNQAELRWSNLLNWLKRGMPGRYLDERNFYSMMMIGLSHPASDGFTWRSHAGDVPNILDGFGQPTIISDNNTLAFCGNCGGSLAWIDWAHGHGYGVGDYYFVSGDEVVKDSLVTGGWKDYFLPAIQSETYQAGYRSNFAGQVNTSGTAVTWAGVGANFGTWWGNYPILINGVVYKVASVADTSHLTLTTSAGSQSGVFYGFEGGLGNSRANGVMLMWYSRFSQFLTALGDTDSTVALTNGQNLYKVVVKFPLCVTGDPSGCSYGPALAGPWLTQGVSPTRGIHYASTNGGYLNYHDPACSGTGIPFGAYRGADTFLVGTMLQGTYEIRQASGSGWDNYWDAMDLAYGMSQWMLSEPFHWDGTSVWYPNNGFGFQVFSDVGNACDPNYQVIPVGVGTVWSPFYIQHQDAGGISSWQTKFNIALQRVMSSSSVYNPEYGDYQMAYDVYTILNPGTKSLQVLTPAVVENAGCASGMGAGVYCVTWTTPSSTDYLRVKYGNLAIVDLIGFDAGVNTYIGNPSTTMNWFAANNATSIPSPVTGSQSMVVNAGTTGLVANNFSVKAFAPSTCNISPSLLPNGTVGISYSQTLTNSLCGSSTWTLVSGSLPTGLSGCTSGSGTTCSITGTPTTPGTYNFTIGYDTTSNPYTIIINSGSVSSNTNSISNKVKVGSGIRKE